MGPPPVNDICANGTAAKSSVDGFGQTGQSILVTMF